MDWGECVANKYGLILILLLCIARICITVVVEVEGCGNKKDEKCITLA